MKAEHDRRLSHVEQLRILFTDHPLVWFSAVELEKPGGRQAWRSRVSDLRRRLRKLELGDIENRCDHHANGTICQSWYRYVPYPRLGRDAGERKPQKTLF